VVVSKPESRAPELIELWRETLDQAPLFGKAIDAGSADYVDAEVAGNLDAVTIVHEQGFRVEFQRQCESFALSGVQSSAAEFCGSGIVGQARRVDPPSLSRDNLACDRKLRAVDGDLLKNRRRNCELTEKRSE